MAEESTNKPARRTERIGRYEILKHIATGGMGIIYEALDVDLDRHVALKILAPDLAAQQMTLIRFQREARAAAQLRHENIVAIFDVGESNGTYYIALEYVEGADLQDYINRKCRLDPEEARQIMIQATRALVHAHENGIVHRDIKPSNFLLTHKDNRLIVKLTDFGLAIRNESDAEFRITKDKTTVGTVDYMSPEQARDSRSADIRSDIYSLGCTFYHMLAGLAPFARGTLPERIIQHMKSAPPDVRKLNKSVPEPLVAIIERMLAKKPDDRYQTPADLLNDLENPDKVGAPAKRGPAPGKLERGPARKLPVEPTQILEKKELDSAIASRPVPRGKGEERDAKQSKNSRVKKPAADRFPDRDEDIDDRAPDEPPPYEDRDVPDPSGEETAPEDEPRKKSGQSSPGWMVVTAGAAGVLGLVLIITLIFGGRTPPPKKDPDTPLPPPAPITGVPQIKIDPAPVVSIDTSAAKMTVAAPVLPIMDTPSDQADQAALRREFHGPFGKFPEAPADATVLRLSRLGGAGPNQFRTLAEAVAQTKPNAFTVIEIHDNGPIYVPALAPLSQRDILVRGAEGYRPLIVWETKKSVEAKLVTTFCALAKGTLILENLDLVMQWSDKTPAAIFDVPDADFHARDCTFSIGGKSPQGQGVALVRRHGTGAENRLVRTSLRRCYVRGADAVLLRIKEVSGALLVEESLIAGYQQPLIDLRGRDADTLEFYCVRSTLVTGQVLLRSQPPGGQGVRPTIACRVLDSILSRDDTTAPQGDLVQIADGVEISKLSWRAANTVYAGWKNLLASQTKTIAGGDLDKWHDHWLYREGDRAVADSWPNHPPSGLEEHPAGTFLPSQSPVAFASLTGAGSIGSVIGLLPAAPEAWIERAFEPRTVPIIPASDIEAPRIGTGVGYYHGEYLDLNKLPDLGVYLNDKLQKERPAPRVVLRLAGKGVCQTSPLRIKGVENLVVHFEPAKDFRDPLTLEVRPSAALNRSALIDMTGGHLELIGARIRLNPITLVPTMIQVKDGSLSLTRCTLQGPHAKVTGAFESLIAVENSTTAPTTLLLRDNALVAGGLLIHLHDHVQLKARNNVFLALGDGVRFEANSSSMPLLHLLDHNTFAVRHTFFTLKTGPDFQAAEPVLLHANSNAFLRPFAEDADKGTLLRGADAWVARGRWSWQGRFNVYDARMHAYFAGPEKTIGMKQARSDWQTIWGQTGEQEPLLLDGPAVKTIAVEGKTQADLLLQLDRLALPAQLRGDRNQNPPGADLVYLGIKKKG